MSSAIVAIVLVLAVVRVVFRVRRRARRRGAGAAPAETTVWSERRGARGAVAKVAGREMKVRFKGRVFRVATVLIILVIGAAIIIPTIHKGTTFRARVGLVGAVSSVERSAVANAARVQGDRIRFVTEPSVAAASAALRDGALDVVLVGSAHLLVAAPISASSSSATAQFVSTAAAYAGLANAMVEARLTNSQIGAIAASRPLPVKSVTAGKAANGPNATSIFGLIVTFIMLSQYNGWILVGVMEEKSNRVIEVLLAAVRPIQLMTGKVIGIGAVAFSQAAVIVAFALLLAKGVGSSLLHGSSPWVVLGSLVWLFLGYAFYCWIYAAAGSMVERQDQAQTLAFPLSLPLIFAYVYSLTEASSSGASLFFKVLAYLPPTAPFAMPTLVGLGEATWWQFTISVAIDLVCTVAMARAAAYVYRRAILRTGGRVHLRDLADRRAAAAASA